MSEETEVPAEEIEVVEPVDDPDGPPPPPSTSSEDE